MESEINPTTSVPFRVKFRDSDKWVTKVWLSEYPDEDRFVDDDEWKAFVFSPLWRGRFEAEPDRFEIFGVDAMSPIEIAKASLKTVASRDFGLFGDISSSDARKALDKILAAEKGSTP